MDRSLSAKVARLLLIRRAMKKLEEHNVELRDSIIDQMEREELEQIKVPSGTVTLYDQPMESVDPIKLVKRYGKDALVVMSVKIGEAKKLYGETTLRSQGLIRNHGEITKLLTRPAPKKKVVKIAC